MAIPIIVRNIPIHLLIGILYLKMIDDIREEKTGLLLEIVVVTATGPRSNDENQKNIPTISEKKPAIHAIRKDFPSIFFKLSLLNINIIDAIAINEKNDRRKAIFKTILFNSNILNNTEVIPQHIDVMHGYIIIFLSILPPFSSLLIKYMLNKINRKLNKTFTDIWLPRII